MTMPHFPCLSPAAVLRSTGDPRCTGAWPRGALQLRQRPPRFGQNAARRRLARDRRHLPVFFSPSDIIPVFYLSPCNSFYISGLCSLEPVQSQPRDTGLYQPTPPTPYVCARVCACVCASLQLTHISSLCNCD